MAPINDAIGTAHIIHVIYACKFSAKLQQQQSKES